METLTTRDTIFISHATLGEKEQGMDNDFSQWLALRLIGLGYKVWCDLKNLRGGEDFWEEIEYEIRDNSIKYLYILSRNSNHRKGTLKELAVADKVKKQLGDQHFIIPLHIDSSLSHDDINIDLVRLNSINFKDGWSKGLADLLERFTDDGVPQPQGTNYDAVSNIWQTVSLCNKTAIEREEIYSSNWFPIIELPESLYFHKFGDLVPLHDFPLWKSRFPATQYKQYLATFARYDEFEDVIPDFGKYDPGESRVLNISQILQGHFPDDFIKEENVRNIIVRLLNLALDRLFLSKGLRKYRMANKRKAYWFEKGVLEKDKANKILMVGKMKYGKETSINWHFSVSGSAQLEKSNYFVLWSHIIFTWDGKKLIGEDGIQHKCRRKQGKDWWNKHWRDKLLSFIEHFSDGDNLITINVGSKETIKMSSTPHEFHSSYGYIDPDEANLPTESDEINLAEEMEEELKTEPEEMTPE